MKQFGKIVTEYELKLKELDEFVLKLVNSEEYLCSKFEEGLFLEIREKMSTVGNQSYKEVVQLALRAEKLTGEKYLGVISKRERDSVLYLVNH